MGVAWHSNDMMCNFVVKFYLCKTASHTFSGCVYSSAVCLQNRFFDQQFWMSWTRFNLNKLWRFFKRRYNTSYQTNQKSYFAQVKVLWSRTQCCNVFHEKKFAQVFLEFDGLSPCRKCVTGCLCRHELNTSMLHSNLSIVRSPFCELGTMDDSIQCWSNLRIEFFKIWCSYSFYRTRHLTSSIDSVISFLWSTASLP